MSGIKIKVDGVEMILEQGQNLLEALLGAGIDLPNLCHLEGGEPFGACGLCLVEEAGQAGPVRACTLKVTPSMEIITDSPRLQRDRLAALRLLLSDHLGDCRPPCRNRCPINNDCQGYIGLAANGYFQEAVRSVKADNPLPACIGRVCPHPCEDECRRALLEGPVAIAAIKRAVADLDLAADSPYIPPLLPESGKKVAIVGSGPAGLTAAYFLARAGHRAEIFEAMPQAGGMLRYGIPEYRLPKAILDREIALITDLGVKINYNCRLGQEVALGELRQKYDAVFLAVGAWQGSGLGCANEDLPGVYSGIDFLRRVTMGERLDLGRRVAVVGGGNTAIDAARTAVRLGAEKVVLVYRRSRNEMPAQASEVAEAEEEGVSLSFLAAPACVLCDGQKVSGLKLQKMALGEPDSRGRRRPEPVQGALEDMRFDSVIAAIGQSVDSGGLEGINLSKWGTIIADSGTYATNLPGVFAGGDAINDGPDIAVTAMSHGKAAAQAIDSYLAGALQPVEKPFLVERKDIRPEDLPQVEELKRTEQRLLSAAKRKTSFEEVAAVLTVEELQKEASRCLECGCAALYDCGLLSLLQKYNPQGLTYSGQKRSEPLHQDHPFITREKGKCILCGLCVRICAERSGKDVLGFSGRGLEAKVETAFDLPLLESDCISCGACAAICPTGALTERQTGRKTPPLPLEKRAASCPYCREKCAFELSYYGDYPARALPLDPERSCSLGRFALIFARNKQEWPRLEKAEQQALINALCGDLRYYKGDKEGLDDPQILWRLLKKE